MFNLNSALVKNAQNIFLEYFLGQNIPLIQYQMGKEFNVL